MHCFGYHGFGDLVVTSPRELVEIPRTLVRFSLSLPEEDLLCPVHEFSWWSLGRNAVDRQMMSRKAVEGGWLILDHAGRLKFRSRLVVTGEIVIGRDDGLSGTSHAVTIQMRFLAYWRTTTGEPIVWGRAPLIRVVGFVVCGSVLNIGSSMMNIERGCMSQYSCSCESAVLGLELHVLFPGIAPCGSLLCE